MNDEQSTAEQLIEILLSKLCFSNNKLGQLIQNLIKFDLIFTLRQIFIISHCRLQLALAIQ